MATTLENAQRHLLGVLDEAWRGNSANGLSGGWSYFGDDDAGLEQSLAGLDLAQATRPLGSTSIAQQTMHVAFGAGIFTAWLRGEPTDADWARSWQLGELDAAGWEQLKEVLQSALAELRAAIAAHALDSDEQLTAAHGAVAHTVYHLGSIRAKLTML